MYRDGLSFDSAAQSSTALKTVMNGVYGWMTFALFLSGLCSWLVGTTPNLAKNLLTGGVFWLFVIGEFALVFIISGLINKLSAAMATALFIAYAALNGVTLGVIFLLYTASSIAVTFLVTAGTFCAMALLGSVTKLDLSKLGSILFMALIGLVIASIVNIFWANSTLYWICTYAGVLIFTGLTAYDVQKIRQLCMNAENEDFETTRKLSILGALTLYLDFVNLMLYLLRILGNRKN